MKDAFVLQLSKSNSHRPRNVGSERLKGRGTVTTGRGKQISVVYQLCLTDSSAEPAEGAGLPGFSGQVWCPHDGSFVSVYQGKILTLCIEDGRKLRFFHQNRDGAIAVTEWLG